MSLTALIKNPLESITYNPSDYDWQQFSIGLFFLLSGIFAFGLNMTVLIMYLKFRSMGSPTALLLANLTISDLGLIIFNYPFAASSSFANSFASLVPCQFFPIELSCYPLEMKYFGKCPPRWLFGDVGCQFHAFFGFFFCTAHIASLTLLAIDRYHATCCSSLHIATWWKRASYCETATSSIRICRACCYCDGMFRRILYHEFDETETYKSYYRMILAVWIHGLVWAIFPLVGWGHYALEPKTNTCTINWRDSNRSYIFFLFSYFVVSFLIPFSVTFLCYFYAGRAIKSKGNFEGTRDPISDYWHTTTNVTMMTILINVTYLLSWTPIAILFFWGAFYNESTIPSWLPIVSSLLAKSTTMYNPLIYYFTNDKLRKGIIAVIMKKDLENFSSSHHNNLHNPHQHHRRSHQLISMSSRYISGSPAPGSRNSSKNNSFETVL